MSTGGTGMPPRGTPLDGGWGWMTVLGFGISQVIGVGFLRGGLSIIYQQFIIRYSKSDTETAWVFALYNATRFLLSKY